LTAEALNDEGVALMNQGRLDEALDRWREALRLKETAEVHNNLGYLHAARGEWDQALASYRRALELKPAFADALNNLGIACFQKGQLDDAARCFRQAIEQRPDFAQAHNNLGNALLALGKPQEAADCYLQVLGLRPGDSAAYYSLGVACAALQQWREAAACWRRSLEGDPTNLNTQRQLGDALNIQGNYPEALLSYQHVLAQRPDDVEARYLVEALRGDAPPTRAPADYVATLFDSYAPHFDQTLVGRLNYRGPEMLQAALELPTQARSLDVLDLGCGTGLCGMRFREWAATLIGVDLSPNMLAKARERGVYDELILGDLLTVLQENEGRFDLILAGDVFVYLGELGPIFEAVKLALRPGGRFAFTVELCDGPGYQLLSTVRFAHSVGYLQNLAKRWQMEELCLREVILRSEFGRNLAGLVVVLRS
jgi:predicted TPR repeat methyltransferase